MAIIEVRPIEKERWHGKKGKDVFTRPKTIEALVSLRTGKYATGLSPEDRTRLEAITGYNLSDEYIQEKAHPFWNSPSGQVKLDYKTNVFDTSLPLNEIRVKILKNSDLVANSMKEYEEGKYPNAVFVIFDEKEENEIKASKASLKRTAIIEASKLPKDRKVELIQIILGINTKNQSNDFIDLKIDDCITTIGSSKFMTLVSRDKTRTTLHSMVLEALQKNVLRKEGSAIYHMDDQIGFDLESAIDYLEDKKNQLFKTMILEKIN